MARHARRRYNHSFIKSALIVYGGWDEYDLGRHPITRIGNYN